jgi:hypothetical protein
VGLDGAVRGRVGDAGEHEAVAHLVVVKEGLVGLVDGTSLRVVVKVTKPVSQCNSKLESRLVNSTEGAIRSRITTHAVSSSRVSSPRTNRTFERVIINHPPASTIDPTPRADLRTPDGESNRTKTFASIQPSLARLERVASSRNGRKGSIERPRIIAMIGDVNVP